MEKKKFFAGILFILFSFCFLITGCTSIRHINKQQKERLLRNNKLIAILNVEVNNTKTGYIFGSVGFIPFYIPQISSNLKSVSINFQNLALQNIKEIIFIVTPHNSEGEIIGDINSGKSISLLKYDKIVLPNKIGKASWKPVWNNKDISYITIESVKIFFITGEEIVYEDNEIFDMVFCEYGKPKKK